ncbi:MAG: response regulator [Candidatus Omnitrophica bacterium]|nr:response regulator [Candidatus Omnitrophota bacterium]
MKKTKVLLVDDEADFLDVMRQRVETWDYDVISQFDPNKAIELIKEKKVDVVVVDYMMPLMDGLTFIRTVRGFDRQIPMIMFTAHPDQRAIEGTEKLSISAFIPKFSSYSDSQSALKTAIGLAEKKLGLK